MSTKMLNKRDASVRVYRDPAELALKAARHFARLADQYVIGSGHFAVALSGGSTPKAMLSLLAASPFIETIPWSSIYFFWGDERMVPPDHADSNYRMTSEALLSKSPVPPENIFRVPTESGDPESVAEAYSDTLRQFFIAGPGRNTTGTAPLANMPRFDLVFLGMGADGHTASLFPHTTALHDTEKIVAANYVEKVDAHRITLTVPTINNARNVTFLVGGADKAPALREVLEGAYQPELYPSQLIRPKNGALLWLVDEAAASGLSQ